MDNIDLIVAIISLVVIVPFCMIGFILHKIPESIERGEEVPEELKEEITISKDWVPTKIQYSFEIGFSLILATILFVNSLGFVFSEEKILVYMSKIFMLLAILLVLVTLTDILLKEKSIKELDDGNYKIKKVILKRRIVRVTGKWKDKTLYFKFKGVIGKIMADREDFIRARKGDEFYLYTYGTLKKCFNSHYYKLSEEDKARLESEEK